MEEEGRRRKKRRRRKGNGGGRECGEGGNELLRMSVEVVQSAFIERAYRNCKERERLAHDFKILFMSTIRRIYAQYVIYFGFFGRHLYSFWVKECEHERSYYISACHIYLSSYVQE